MDKLICNGCLEPLPYEGKPIVTCPICFCTNKVEAGRTRVIYNDLIDMNSNRKNVRISHDLLPYMDSLRTQGWDYTEMINQGIALFINSLPDKVKKQVGYQRKNGGE